MPPDQSQAKSVDLTRFASSRLLVALLLAGLIIGLTMHSAVRRGMDHAVMIGPGDQAAIAISLSDSIYKVGLGYVGLKKVFDTIQSYWNRDASGWSNLEQLKVNFHDRELLNAGIRAAASLGPQTPGYFADGSLITTFYDDMGEVDYVTLAFGLFGLKIEALFYFYFTLVSLAALVFILTFQDRAFALAVVLTTLFAYYVEQFLDFFDLVAIPTYWGMRHSSTLCLIPAMHFAFLLLWRKKLSWAVAAGTALQLAILILAWRVRGSVAWVFIFVTVLAAALAVFELWPHSVVSRPRSWVAAGRGVVELARSVATLARSWRSLLRGTLRWPVVFLLLGLVANAAYNRAMLHPIYKTDDVMPYHGIWHSVHLGLILNAPDAITPRASHAIKTEGLSDGSTAWIARDYLDSIHLIPWDGRPSWSPSPAGYVSPWPGLGPKIALHERVLRNVYFERLKSQPLRFFQLYASRPMLCLQVLATPFTQARTLTWLWLVAAGGVGAFIMLIGLARTEELGDAPKVLAVGAAAIFTATSPNMLAYVAAYAMADSILMIAGFMAASLGIGAYALLRSLQRRALPPAVLADRGA